MESVRINPRPKHVTLHVRKLKFAFEEKGFERNWHSHSPFISTFWAALSSSLPAGEAFHIDSVRSLKDRVKDPELLADIEKFTRQEGHHTHHHLEFDRMNREHGRDIDACHRRADDLFASLRKQFSPIHRLAVTLALEHFTACLARQLLMNPRMSRGADPRIMAFWAWHGVEEIEHKATPYDVFLEVGGGYGTRIMHWCIALLALPVYFVGLTFYLLAKQKELGNPADLGRGLWHLFGYRGFFPSLLPAALAYFRPSYHPWDHDDSDALQEWERRAEEQGGNLWSGSVA